MISFDVSAVFASVYLDLAKQMTKNILHEHYLDKPRKTNDLHASYVPMTCMNKLKEHCYL